jgi:uncharacterized protein (TIGR03435 family)
MAFGIPIAFSPAAATTVQNQPRSQSAAFDPSDFRFEVASIKPTKTPDGGFYLNDTSDGITGRNVPLVYLVKQAFGIYEDFRYSGAPNWLRSDCYDVEAKMETSVAEQFRKLPRAQRILAEHHMLQVLLAERFNLKVHRETKEVPVYFLVVARNGPKLQESKPNPDDPKAPKNAVWHESMKNGLIIMPAELMPIEQLASRLSGIVGRKVLDKTELTGKYDFTLQYAEDQSAPPVSAGASEGQPTPNASDPNGTTIFTALQDQLGLKLASGKGPIEIIVIDHVERASGN